MAHLKKGRSGHLMKVRTSGHLSKGCISPLAAYKLLPCYKAVSGSCSQCDTPLPKYMTATVTGVDSSMCLNTCIPHPTLSFSGKLLNGSTIDGTYVIPHDESPNDCIWGGDPVNGLEISDRWDTNTTCSGSRTFHTNRGWRVNITRSGQSLFPPFPAGDFWRIRVTGFVGTVFRGQADAIEGNCAPRGVVITNIVTCPWEFGIGVANGGIITIWGGDIAGGGSCPGGSPIYTNTDLSSSVGKVVTIGGVCYAVADNTDPEISDGDVTVTATNDNCAACCA